MNHLNRLALVLEIARSGTGIGAMAKTKATSKAGPKIKAKKIAARESLFLVGALKGIPASILSPLIIDGWFQYSLQ